MNMSQRISRRLVHFPASVTFNLSQAGTPKSLLYASASLRLCVKILALGAADKPKGIDWSWPGRSMAAKSG